MPFKDQDKFYGPMAIPDGLDISPETPEFEASVLGAAFRQENPIISMLGSSDHDPMMRFDPDYNPWQDVQGTKYEAYGDKFAGALNSEDVSRMKNQIDQEIEDRSVLDAAGGMGILAQFGAALMSPTTLLPGGAVVQSAKGGVRIGSTALKVGGSAALATAIDEAVLQQTQQIRTGAESGLAIGGSFILGSVLGAAAGKLTSAQFKKASSDTEAAIQMVHEYDRTLKSMGAAENVQDLSLRREEIFQTLNAIPGLRAVVRSDPILRAQLSPLESSRRAVAELAETPLQYKVNEEGMDVRSGNASVEMAVMVRERNQLAQSIAYLQRSFAEYSKDGPVGTVGTITAPITSRWRNIMSKDRKMTGGEFMEEVGRAMREGDKHPIPQVQRTAEQLRSNIFDSIKDEAIEAGIFDPDLKVKNASSYISRVYNVEKIRQHLGDGTANDIKVLLAEEFRLRRARAQEFLANDRTVFNLETDAFKLKEQQRSAKKALDEATQKVRDKRDRAKGAIAREGAVGRATGALRKTLKRRSDDLKAKTLDVDERAALKDALKDARGVNRLEPVDIMQEIRSLGGIRDDGAGELKEALDTMLLSIKRNDGMTPDDMRGVLEELGYLPEGSTVNDLYDALRQSAGGEKIYSRQESGSDIDRYFAALEFRQSLEELGIDVSAPIDDIIAKLPGMADDQKVAKAKSGEAKRSSNKAGKSEDSAVVRAEKAIDRLEDAQARLKEINEEVAPKVRDEIKGAQEELRKLLPELKKAKKNQSAEEFYAQATDRDVDRAVDDAVMSLLQLGPSDHHFSATMTKPTRARVLDVDDVKLEPWLESNVNKILGQYTHHMVPMLEMGKRFGGDYNMKEVLTDIAREAVEKAGGDPSVVDQGVVDGALSDLMGKAGVDLQKRANRQILEEAENRITDIEGMRDRILRRYGVPANPKSGWVQAGRVGRTMSYMGYLGGMMLSAIPDLAGMVGRGGIEAAFGSVEALTRPRKFFNNVADISEFGASAEWYLNSRAIATFDMFDPYTAGSRMEQALGAAGSTFSVATGMIPWNIAWKSVGGTFAASRMSKAAEAVRQGKASKKQLLVLGANGIEPAMAERIAKQVEVHGDTNGLLWMPNGKMWDDAEAFDTFRRAMNREFDLMVITPGQDKPLSFSTEAGKFFFQFKSFALSAHHRILLAGLQRSDGEALAQLTTAVILGGLVSNIKSDLGGYDRKEGVAFWEDAIDRSGMAGWLMEPYNIMAGVTGGATSVSGEAVSRYQARSIAQGMTGPSIDMGVGVFEAANAFATGNQTYRDVRKVMRPIPGNNIWYLLPLFRKVEEAGVELTGAKPRPE